MTLKHLDLQACPFCGGAAEVSQYSAFDGFTAKCTKCGTEGPEFISDRTAGLWWNTRADATCALRGAQKESGWRPIETAPKDGSEFVARGFNYNDPAKGRHHEIAHWNGVAFVATPDGMSIVLDYLTDWAPLPTDSTPEGEAK